MSELIYSPEGKNKFFTKSKIRALNYWMNAKGERLNFLSHLFGMLLATGGLILLLEKAIPKYGTYEIIGFLVYALSLILMFLSSTVYHATIHKKVKKFLQVIDHCVIYLLIAGTYTPFAMITLRESKGQIILISVWSIAFFGITFKLIFKDKYDMLATLGYVLMGWLVLLDVKNFYNLFPREGFYYVLAGGIFYTIGAIFYLLEKLPRNHEIWHGFVLLGAFSHFLAIYWFLV
ncbi:MAG: hemolysin III family protein [Leptospiraceae bacterium]|nr:hemolysin III family protein [Leptospiraceae bacterium]